jgi:hypothetical protein
VRETSTKVSLSDCPEILDNTSTLVQQGNTNCSLVGNTWTIKHAVTTRSLDVNGWAPGGAPITALLRVFSNQGTNNERNGNFIYIYINKYTLTRKICSIIPFMIVLTTDRIQGERLSHKLCNSSLAWVAPMFEERQFTNWQFTRLHYHWFTQLRPTASSLRLALFVKFIKTDFSMNCILHKVSAFELHRESTLLSNAPGYPKNIRRVNVSEFDRLSFWMESGIRKWYSGTSVWDSCMLERGEGKRALLC